jgi:hypothetical protein
LPKRYSAALLLGLPVFAQAAVNLPLTCDSTVKSFFAPLVQANLIEHKPFIVDEHSLNHFRPKLLSHLAAYGMPVSEVFGYTDDQLLFIKKPGLVDGDVYGVVVKETIANVQAQLSSAGAIGARTYRVDAHSTAIVCKGVIE